jgi:protein ImuB
MLWLAIRLPQLPLDMFLRGSPTPQPFAVTEGHHILVCDHKASLRGVRPGMASPTALALAPRIIIRERDAAAETEALLGLAAWAMQFTSSVVLEFPDSLLLEISGSLKLLGTLDSILSRLGAELANMGFTPVLACAPTLRAACWSTHACRLDAAPVCLTPDTLEQAVSALPVTVLPQAIQQPLQSIGTTCIGEVLALPRNGLARRFGQRLLDDIDRALGRLPEARTLFQPPEIFHAAIELPTEARQSETLLFAAKRLFTQLSGFLAARRSGVQRISVKLSHRDTVTDVAIGMLTPTRDTSHFTLLLREQLARIILREPVRAITVSASEVLPLAGNNLALFSQDAASVAQPWQLLLERLQARLGSQSVQNLAMAADHRPEQASVATQIQTETVTKQMQLNFGERPFWLLPAPHPLGSMPHYQGPLELLAGPERIESGWWDGNEAMRDYFVARSPQRSLLWIYRERHPSRMGMWYLHGIFS